ncbi:MAG: hypothetical protein ACLQJR_30695 [Stellaceae bacterium]
MAYNFADLERRFYGTSETPALTAEILGKIIAGAWKRAHPENKGFLSHDQLTKLIVKNFSAAPSAVGEILHFEHRPDGTKIEEITRLIIGAQNAGFLVRANPQNLYTHIKADLMQTYTMLDGYALNFPDVVAWADKVAASGSGETD